MRKKIIFIGSFTLLSVLLVVGTLVYKSNYQKGKVAYIPEKTSFIGSIREYYIVEDGWNICGGLFSWEYDGKGEYTIKMYTNIISVPHIYITYFQLAYDLIWKYSTEIGGTEREVVAEQIFRGTNSLGHVCILTYRFAGDIGSDYRWEYLTYYDTVDEITITFRISTRGGNYESLKY